MTVQPATTTTYRILARSLGFSTGLGSVTVPVATEACITGSLGEAEVQSQLRAAINAVDAATSRIKQRSQAAVSVDPNGIKVAVRMEIAINNFPDPDLDVDFTLGLQVRNGAVEPFFHRFSVDVDWPVWVTTVSLGITKIVEEVVENEIEGRLKTEILAKAKEAVGGVLAQLPPALKLHRITLAQDKIDVTVCPAGPDRPHVVLGTRGVGAVLGTAIHRLDDVDPKP